LSERSESKADAAISARSAVPNSLPDEGSHFAMPALRAEIPTALYRAWK
jgi:hypothetical protein